MYGDKRQVGNLGRGGSERREKGQGGGKGKIGEKWSRAPGVMVNWIRLFMAGCRSQ